MSWGLLDDKLYVHPKFAAVSLEATGLWTLCQSYANDNLTDGKLPRGQVVRFAASAAKAKKLAAELVAAGLWHETTDGYQVHDFHQYNYSAEQVREGRAQVSQKRAEAGRKGAASRWGKDSKPSDKESLPPPAARRFATAVNGKPHGKSDVCHIASMANSKQMDGPQTPDPLLANTTDKTENPEGDASGRSVVSENGHGKLSSTEAREFVERHLAEHPHWRETLAAMEAAPPPGGIRKLHNWRAGVIQNWLDGDGTPAEPGAKTAPPPGPPAPSEPAAPAIPVVQGPAHLRAAAEQAKARRREAELRAAAENPPPVSVRTYAASLVGSESERL